MTKRIPLTQGKFALVDDDLFDFLNQWKWYAIKKRGGTGTWYAVRHSPGNHNKIIRMHNVVMNTPEGIQPDHIDRNGLNNQRHNLRYANNAQNAINQKKRNNTSGYIGVNQRKNRWVARVCKSGKWWSKFFPTAIEAALARDEMAIKLHGEFAVLNFPREE